ncbi:MAG: TonB-dependent receptor [Rhodospirillales bacterium]|nr:TonB-dependent receptor [Rhodospirillales bacterium]
MSILALRPPRAALILAFFLATFATYRGQAQSGESGVLRLPETVVTATRVGDGVTGASTTVITAEEIERSPAATLQELLAREPGIQAQTLFGGGTGSRNTVDMRGFGAAATSNTLVLVNGRRLNDVDMAGVDYTAIPRGSIARIEITRGNSGAVLYGDGAVGGVINIVTKTGIDTKPGYRIDGGLGSYDYREGAASAVQVFGPVSVSIHANAVHADGYRHNNVNQQRNANVDVRYKLGAGSVYVNLSADDQHTGLPAGRLVTPTSSELIINRRGATTPRDFAEKNGFNATIGGTRMLADNIELVLDGGVRQKVQHSEFFTSGSEAAVDTTLLMLSLTPRFNIQHSLFGAPSKTTAGIDISHSNYNSDRGLRAGVTPYNHADVDQLSFGVYIQENVALRPDTDFSAGIRFVSADMSAGTRRNASAPGGGDVNVGIPSNRTEEQYAAHLGLDHRLTEWLALFGRAGRSLRIPTVDERVSLAPFATPIIDLRTQTSQDIEAGFRVNYDRFDFQSSAYVMKLKHELHFSSATFSNVNLEPTRREGVETIVGYRITDAIKLKGGFAYTDAEFRSGSFKGKKVPLVSDWTGRVGVGWDVFPKMAALDFDVRYIGDRRFDNDQRNVQPLIQDHTVVDLRIGGDIDWFRWSFSVLNLFDTDYFDYGIASTSVIGRYNAYPQPGRTFLARLGASF